LTAIAAGGNEVAMDTLVTIGARGGVLRDQSAIGLGTVAVMNPEFMLRWLDRTPQASRDAVITLLKDGFDDLEEDFGEEQFFAATRAAYWAAAEGSAARSLSSQLIQRLEF
jgi:hypothetical protein